jgi:hypothetical protein
LAKLLVSKPFKSLLLGVPLVRLVLLVLLRVLVLRQPRVPH